MTLADLAAYTSKSAGPRHRAWIVKDISAPISANDFAYSQWTVGTNPAAAAAPTAAAACTNSSPSPGSIVPGLSESADCFLSQVRVASHVGQKAMLWVLDRLCHQGGLSGTALGAQTTNLPTAALTRYTSGVGVFPFIEIYTAVGSSSSVSISYTNQAGTPGQISESVPWSSADSIRSFFPISLAAGDTGCRSVESVTNAASSGAIGNFGITLARPLMIVEAGRDSDNASTPSEGEWDALASGAGNLPLIVPNACLMVAYMNTLTFQQNPLVLDMAFIR